MKSGFFLKISRAKNHGYTHHPHRPQVRIALAGRRCSIFGGTRKVYYELLKPGETLIPNAINNNWSIWTVRCLKNDQNTKRGNRSFFSMLYHIRQNQFGTRWKHSAEKFYPMRLTHQTWLLPIIICLHRWVSHLMSSALVRSHEDVKKWFDEWFAAKGEDFYWRGPQIARKMEKMCN